MIKFCWKKKDDDNLREECKNKPVFLVERAPWYKEVLSRKGLKYKRKEITLSNLGFFRLKKRVKNFYKRFPTNSSIKAVESWDLSFIVLYNLKSV